MIDVKTDLKQKQTYIKNTPTDWRSTKLEHIVKILDNKRIPLSEIERGKRKGVYPYCGANGIIDYIDDYIFDGEFILLAEDGGDYGKFANTAYLMKGKFWVNNHAHILSVIEEEADPDSMGVTTNKVKSIIESFMS